MENPVYPEFIPVNDEKGILQKEYSYKKIKERTITKKTEKSEWKKLVRMVVEVEEKQWETGFDDQEGIREGWAPVRLAPICPVDWNWIINGREMWRQNMKYKRQNLLTPFHGSTRLFSLLEVHMYVHNIYIIK